MAVNAPHLKRRGNTYYARLRVPAHLVRAVGKDEIVRSLKTQNVQEAKSRLREFLGEVEAYFKALEQVEPGSPKDIIGKAQAFRKELDLGLRGLTEKDVVSYAEGLDYQRYEYLYPRGAEAKGVELDPERGSILEADQKKLDAFNLASLIVQNDDQSAFLMVSDALAAHLEEIAVRVRNQTVNARRKRVEAFIEWLGGDKEIQKVTKQMAGHYLTQNLMKQGKSVKTLRDTVSDIGAFFTWAADRGQIEINPFAGLTKSIKDNSRGVREKRDSKRRAFTTEELKKLLVTLRDDYGKDDPLWPLVVIGLYTGMRGNEVAEIEIKDVHDTYIHIPEGKTDSAIRDVPIHPIIADLVKSLKESSTDGYLISGLIRGGEDAKRYQMIGKRFGYTLRQKVKIKDERVVYHSLRKNFTTVLENNNVPLTTAQQIIGHSKQTIAYGLYSQGVDLSRIEEIVGKVSYGTEIDTLVNQD